MRELASASSGADIKEGKVPSFPIFTTKVIVAQLSDQKHVNSCDILSLGPAHWQERRGDNGPFRPSSSDIWVQWYERKASPSGGWKRKPVRTDHRVPTEEAGCMHGEMETLDRVACKRMRPESAGRLLYMRRTEAPFNGSRYSKRSSFSLRSLLD